MRLVNKLLFLVVASTFLVVHSFGDSRARARVGVTLPLTGALAEYGAAVKNGIELAKATLPSEFSSLEFLYEDNQFDPKLSISGFNKLKNLDKAQVIYSWGEPVLHAIAPLAERSKFPLIAMSVDPAPAIGKKYVIRSINPAEDYVHVLLKYLRSNKLKKILILQAEDPFFESLIASLRANLNASETLEVAYTFSPDVQEFRTPIANLKARSFDVLGVYLFPGQVSSFYRQSKEQNLSTPTFGTDIFESESEIKAANGNMDGAVYPNILVPEGFASKYREVFKNDTQVAYAYNSYEFALAAANVFKSITDWNAETILRAFEEVPKRVGVPYVFQDKQKVGKYFGFPMVVRRIELSKIRDLSLRPN